MKKLSLLMGMLILLFTTSCRDIVNTVLDALPPFDVPFTTTVTVPFVNVSTTTYTRTPEIPMNINLDAKIKENNPNYSINNLKSVKMSTLSMDFISSTVDTKLDVIKNARVYIKAPNQPEKLIATVVNNTNPNIVTFTVPDEELINYFKTSQNSLIFEIQASAVAADQITMKMNTGFKVKVQL
ncbi:hypothetical protein [Chryseobacterium sp. HSC-36S06]|uniref:hypothetical protein n=1 Tax=Chryseobacterium sp. HSC-36S06 TaxID=2910970 RepID=UPI00209E01F6|nr:hypothetical protein [Chryseobacterium sp. HSC-36S06]MCP2038397.1 hypothetical protein [Chryseobacterium sp. HSC-36S06]